MNFDFAKPLPDGLNIVGGGWRRNHAGFDIAVPTGTPVMAIGDGFITHAGTMSDMGTFVVIAHASGVVSRYLHLSQLNVSAGQAISKGDVLGLSGNTGLSAGPHLHIDLKVPADLVDAVRLEVGEPVGGFEANITGFGIGIPAEPWIPADSYVTSVEANAAANQIPLYQPRGITIAKKSLMPLVAGAVIGALIFWFSKRR